MREWLTRIRLMLVRVRVREGSATDRDGSYKQADAQLLRARSCVCRACLARQGWGGVAACLARRPLGGISTRKACEKDVPGL